jgi:hydrophobic/amphiphilic exporter-1 (mainly G- bacteria), HAE1 family
MQWLAQVCVRRPVLAGVLMLVIFVLGGVGYTRLGLDQFPNIDLPFVLVTTTLDGAAPEEMESDVSDKIEGAVNTIDGIDELRSTSSEGFSQVAIAFKIDKPSDIAAQDVRDKVSNILRDLPRGIDAPIVSKVDPQAAPVLLVALRSREPIREVTEIADKRVRRQIESISGVGQVTIVGGRARQVHVRMDPVKLRAYNLSAVDVQRALAAQNLTTPGGSVDTGPQAITLRIAGRVTTVDALGRIVLRDESGHIVRIEDVAVVEDAEEELTSIASYDGERTVVLSVRKQSGTNTVEVVDTVLKRLEEVKRTLPPSIKLEVIRDNSASIRTGVGAVKEHLIVGALLAAAVVLLFLGNARSTLIAAISIPISIVGTFALMWMQGFTLNMLTLLALALAVGIVIDDAIVVLENIVRYIEEKGMKPFPAAVLATREIGLPVLATTLSLMAVFVPVAFVGGIPGRFLKNFGYTMAFAVGVSMFVSFALTPTLSARLLGGASHQKGKGLSRIVDWFYRPVERVYMAILTWCMRHRWVVMVACGLSLASCGQLMKHIPTGFVPVDDQAQFEVSLRAPEGTSADETALIAERVAQEVRRLSGVLHTVTTVAGGDAKVQNLASVYVALKDPRERSVSQLQLMDQTRKQILAKLPKNLRVSVAEVAAISAGASSAAVQYVLAGPDLHELEALAAKMEPEIKKNPAVVDFDTNLITGKPELRVSIDRDRASDLGVNVSDVADTLRMLVAGLKASTYSEQGGVLRHPLTRRKGVPTGHQRHLADDGAVAEVRHGAAVVGGEREGRHGAVASQPPRSSASSDVHGQRRSRLR